MLARPLARSLARPLAHSLVGNRGDIAQIRSLAIVGGSTIDYNHVVASNQSYFANNGFAAWMCAKLRQRLMFAYNASDARYEFGTYGFVNSQILATHIPQVITAAPDAALLYCGINDVGNGSSGATVWNGIYPMVTALLAANIKPIVMLLGPRLSSAVGGAGYWTRQIATNNAILAGCQSLGVKTYDPNPVWQDAGTGEPLAGVLIDGIHPSVYGASILGDDLADWMTANVNLGPSPFDSARIASLKGFNPTFSGGTTQATGWTAGGFGGTRTPSKVAAVDGGNNWQQINHTGTTRATHYGGIYSVGSPLALPSGIAAGDKVRLWCEFEVDAGHQSWQYAVARCLFNGTGLKQINTLDGASSSDAGASYEVLVPSGVYCSPVIQIPNDATTYSLSAEIKGGGIARWRNFGLEKVTSYNPPAIGS